MKLKVKNIIELNTKDDVDKYIIPMLLIATGLYVYILKDSIQINIGSVGNV